jgi:hypothetical protein
MDANVFQTFQQEATIEGVLHAGLQVSASRALRLESVHHIHQVVPLCVVLGPPSAIKHHCRLPALEGTKPPTCQIAQLRPQFHIGCSCNLLITDSDALLLRATCCAGVLHVSAMQADNCLQLQACRGLKCLDAPAVANGPSGLWEVLQSASGHDSAATELAKSALCLATPDEGITEEQHPLSLNRSTTRTGQASGSVSTRAQAPSSSFQSSSSSRVSLKAPALQEPIAEVSTRAAVLQEELAQMALLECAEWVLAEGVACQETLRLLRAATAVRRQRRGALMRVLGSARRAARQAGMEAAEHMARARMVAV